MSLPPSASYLLSPFFSDPAISRLFSDSHFVRLMLDVEAALARVEARLDIIPAGAATAITRAAATLEVDSQRLRAGVEQAGVPVIALVAMLREEVGAGAADYVHWGATSQDIMDTARVMQVRAALAIMEPQLEEVTRALATLADRHRRTLMAGRTHAQQALPITFGLKVAGWLAPLLRQQGRLAELGPRLLVVQFGGAAGTLAALGDRGLAVQAALAAELDLTVPPLPWHTHRDGLVEFAGWLSLTSGCLARMAQDIILMSQSEVAEVRESADPARGGSSTMPQKSNPIVSEHIIAAARANASLLAAMHQALVQEHERATHGWQLEWLSLPPMVELSAAALNNALFLAQNLVVDEERMRANVAHSHGLMLAEAITFALAPAHMSRAEAKRLVGEACQVTLQEKRHLVDVVRERVPPDAGVDWDRLRDETAYLGAAEALIDRVLAGTRKDEGGRMRGRGRS